MGSITKQFTAAAIMLLADQGKLSISDDITKFLPGYPTHGVTITIENLLTHTSGIKSYTTMPKYAEIMRNNMMVQQMIDFSRTNRLSFNLASAFPTVIPVIFYLVPLLKKYPA